MTAFDPTDIWSMILAVSVLTYGMRAAFLLGIDYLGSFPPAIERLLAYFPVAILSALVAPNVLLFEGSLALGVDNPRLVAGVVAVGVAWYTERLLVTVAVGMAVFWALLFVV